MNEGNSGSNALIIKRIYYRSKTKVSDCDALITSSHCNEKKLYTIKVKAKATMTRAIMARGRLTPLGNESFFNIRIKAKQNATIIKVRMEAELLT